MGLLIINAAFCLSLSFMLASCVSDQEQLQKSLPKGNCSYFDLLGKPVCPMLCTSCLVP